MAPAAEEVLPPLPTSLLGFCHLVGSQENFSPSCVAVYVIICRFAPQPFLFSLVFPFRNKEVVKPILQALLLQFLSGTECFLQGRVMQFCLKISLWCLNVVSDWKR